MLAAVARLPVMDRELNSSRSAADEDVEKTGTEETADGMIGSTCESQSPTHPKDIKIVDWEDLTTQLDH